MRLVAYGLTLFTQADFLFELGLVVIGVAGTVEDLAGAQGLSSFSFFMVCRSFRIFRVALVVRMLELFQDLWKLFRGLPQSTKTVLFALSSSSSSSSFTYWRASESS